MAFRCEIPVRFADCDAAWIVYHPRIPHFCHVAMETMFARHVGVPYARALREEDVGYPTVRLEAEYRRPIPMGATLLVDVSVARLGNRSVDLRYEGRLADGAEPVFVVRARQVATSLARWESRDMPPHHRQGFAALLEREDPRAADGPRP